MAEKKDTKAASEKTLELSEICNEFGLDSVGTSRATEAIRELQHRGIVKENPAALREWVRQISLRKTELSRLAGDGLAALENVYGTDLLPRSPKAPRDGVKQKVTEEMTALIDAMGCCLFAAASFQPEDFAKTLSDASGNACSPERILEFGREILLLERSF